jgi:hypothetical protein
VKLAKCLEIVDSGRRQRPLRRCSVRQVERISLHSVDGYNSLMKVDAEEIPRSYAEAVDLLVKWQRESGPSDLRLVWFPDPLNSSVRLAAVSDEFPRAGSAWALPLGPSIEFPFRSEVVMLTPEEWDQVTAGQMPLPAGWNLMSRRQVWP